MINESNRIQFERGVMQYTLLVEESLRDRFLTIAATKLNKYIRKHDCLPDSLLKFCNETNRKVVGKRLLLTIPPKYA